MNGRPRLPLYDSAVIAIGFVLLQTTLAAQSPTWRPVILGKKHMVAAGHYATAMAGYRMLEQGGNALDAGVAATFASTVVEPHRAGIGGHLLIMYYEAETGKVTCIDGSGWSGRRATGERFRSIGLPADGALAVLVPGAVEALLRAWEMFGKLPREKLLDPSVEMADDGFVVSQHLHDGLRRDQKILKKFPATARVWFPGWNPVRTGDIVVQKELAHTFRLIAQSGRDAFYRGPIAHRIVQFLRENGGILEESDFAEYKAAVSEPLFVNYRGYQITDGHRESFRHVVLESLKILQDYDLSAMGHNSAEYIHYLSEAMKLSFADRDAIVGDARFPEAMEQIVRDEFIRERRQLIRMDRAMDVPPPGEFRLGSASTPEPSVIRPVYAATREAGGVRPEDQEHSQRLADGLTTYVAAIDEHGNMASIVSSVSSNFGSKMYVDGDGGGFFLNNWLRLFRTDPSHPNVVMPRKVPRTGWNAMLVLKDGKPFMSFGTPGGDTIPQLSLQFFLNFVDFGMNVQEALEQPGITTTVFRGQYYPNAVGKHLVASERIPESVRDQLAEWGHNVRTHSTLGLGDLKSIWLDAERGVLQGGAAPGTNSYVIGR